MIDRKQARFEALDTSRGRAMHHVAASSVNRPRALGRNEEKGSGIEVLLYHQDKEGSEVS